MTNPKKSLVSRGFAAGFGGLAMLAVYASAGQSQTAAPAAPVLPAAGSYQLDPGHASVIARIGHGGGISFSTFRFGKAEGSLDWDGANPEQSRVDVQVDPASIMTPVPKFGEELLGERFLNTAKFPDSRFVSKSIRITGPGTGVISGDLTFMGVTRPIDVDANLVGSGKDFRGNPVIGFSGKTSFNRADFGFTTMMGPIGNEVELVLDLEFKQVAAAK